VNEGEQQLEQFREDLRRMGPDGTMPEKHETLGEYLKRLFPEPGDMVLCPPEFNKVFTDHLEDILG
jgi:hypothetical protein